MPVGVWLHAKFCGRGWQGGLMKVPQLQSQSSPLAWVLHLFLSHAWDWSWALSLPGLCHSTSAVSAPGSSSVLVHQEPLWRMERLKAENDITSRWIKQGYLSAEPVCGVEGAVSPPRGRVEVNLVPQMLRERPSGCSGGPWGGGGPGCLTFT